LILYNENSSKILHEEKKMKSNAVKVGILLFASILALGGCGPSPEEAATMTAAVWTATPVPPTATPTPTPIPYDLTLSILDAEGNPISGASIEALDVSGGSAVSDDTGKHTFANLPGESVTLSADAQGYAAVEQTVSLVRGPNEASIILERAPFEILPSEACQPGQTLLYLEDFEDGEAQGWENFTRPTWALENDPEHGTVLTAKPEEGQEDVWMRYGEQLFSGDIVWHMDLRRGPQYWIMWLRSHSIYDISNIAVFFGDSNLAIQREGEGGSMLGSRYNPIPDGTVWEHFSMATYGAAIDVYLDDELVIGANAPSALDSGYISITMKSVPSVFSFDNIVVCQLTGPYTPPTVEE
jgi:hypothetical protein